MNEFDEFDDTTGEEASEPQSMSLMGGIAGGGALPGPDGFIAGDGNDSKRVAQQSFLIGLIVTIVAFGALAGMRLTQNGADAAAVSAETEQFMANLAVQLENLDKMDPSDPLHPDNITRTFQNVEQIVAAIEDDPTKNQVPIEQVQMNPFTPVKAKTKAPEVVVDNSAQERAIKLQQLYGELSRVDVQSLVGGSRARAFIGGDLYKVGDTLGSFTIKSIDNRKIEFTVPGFELQAGDAPFILGMSRGR
ncbi:MAG: hypothetical protein AAF333_04020 [Planctomycetota bacterium]